MTSCEQISSRLALYLTNDLDPAEHEQVTRHLEVCPACRHELTDMQLVRRLLKKQMPDLPPGYAAELVVRLHERLDRRRIWKRRLYWAVPAFGAACLLVSLSLFNVFKHPDDQNATNGLMVDLFTTLSHSGYFSHLPEQAIGILDEEPSPMESQTLLRNTANVILYEPENATVDDYLMVTAPLDDGEFRSLLNQLNSLAL